MKTACVLIAALMFTPSLLASEVRPVAFAEGPHSFRPGDRIKIKEVRSSSSEFEVGSEVIVRGDYLLRSRASGRIGLFVTRKEPSQGSAISPEQTVKVASGSGQFELRIKVLPSGFLHVSFYPAEGGSAFGGVYFGTEKQMKDVTHWNLATYSGNKQVENQSPSPDVTWAKDKSMQGPSRGIFDPEFDPRARRWPAVDLIYDGSLWPEPNGLRSFPGLSDGVFKSNVGLPAHIEVPAVRLGAE
jgi:hypothetical protein